LRRIVSATSACWSKNACEKSSGEPLAGAFASSHARASARNAASSGVSSMSTGER